MYKAVLFAPDGDWVTDYRGSNTIKDVQLKLADQGSRWFFYPFHAVIRDRGSITTGTQRIVDAAWPFEDMKGKSLNAFAKKIAGYPLKELLQTYDHIFHELVLRGTEEANTYMSTWPKVTEHGYCSNDHRIVPKRDRYAS